MIWGSQVGSSLLQQFHEIISQWFSLTNLFCFFNITKLSPKILILTQFFKNFDALCSFTCWSVTSSFNQIGYWQFENGLTSYTWFSNLTPQFYTVQSILVGIHVSLQMHDNCGYWKHVGHLYCHKCISAVPNTFQHFSHVNLFFTVTNHRPTN